MLESGCVGSSQKSIAVLRIWKCQALLSVELSQMEEGASSVGRCTIDDTSSA